LKRIDTGKIKHKLSSHFEKTGPKIFVHEIEEMKGILFIPCGRREKRDLGKNRVKKREG